MVLVGGHFAHWGLVTGEFTHGLVSGLMFCLH